MGSISFLPSVLGHLVNQQQHEYLYWEFYEQDSAQTVRMGRWKVVRQPIFEGKAELYNLRTDLGESTNVAAQHPAVGQQIKQIMDKAHRPSSLW